MRVRQFAISMLSVASALLLSGCLAVDADVQVWGAGDVTGVVSVDVPKPIAKQAGATSTDTAENAILSLIAPYSGTSVDDTDCSVSDAGESYTLECALDTTTFGAVTSPVSVTETADGKAQFIFERPAIEDSGAELGSIDLKVRMPGTLISVEGERVTKVDDQTVLITGTLADEYNVTLVSEITDSRPAASSPVNAKGPVVPVIAVLVSLAAGAGVAYIVVNRMQRKSDAEAATSPDEDGSSVEQ